MEKLSNHWTDDYFAFVENKSFPCIAAKAALAESHILTFVADHLACPKDDRDIVDFLHNFVDIYRASEKPYHSAVVIFRQPEVLSEDDFDRMMWQRLQAISNADASEFAWDPRVSMDADSSDFSFSIKREGMYVIGLHSGSSRAARQFRFPALVFNPHDQFVRLRENNKYAAMKEAVRKRDVKLSGSVNPMLTDFGEASEAFQYSGKKYESSWKCPFVARHGSAENNSAP